MTQKKMTTAKNKRAILIALISVGVFCLCFLLSFVMHRPLLDNPQWLILDDASDIHKFFRPLCENPNINTLRLIDNNSRFRPVHWIVRTSIYAIGDGQPKAFWWANVWFLSISLFMGYAIARLFTQNLFTPILAPLLLFASPPVVEIFYSLSAQERWLLLFGSIFVYLLLLTDKLIAKGGGWKKVVPVVGATWFTGLLFLYSKEPAMVSVFFPLLWMAVALPWSDCGKRFRRIGFLLCTFVIQLLLAVFPLILRTLPTWGGGEKTYASDYTIDWAHIGASHDVFKILLLPRIWPLLIILPIAITVALVLWKSPAKRVSFGYVRPVCFFALVAFLQYAIILPWNPQVRYLLPAALPFVLVSTLCVDYLAGIVLFEKRTPRQTSN